MLSSVTVPFDPAARGYHAVYRENEVNHCPGCGRTHWLVGRVLAECGFCATALPLPAARAFGLRGLAACGKARVRGAGRARATPLSLPPIALCSSHETINRPVASSGDRLDAGSCAGRRR